MPDLSILIVDDDEDIAINVSDILREFGYACDTAFDGASALNLVENNSYDIVLLDFKMPDMDGAKHYGRIKKIQPQLVAFMVTAYAGSHGIERAMNAGVSEVMQKPVDIHQLLERVSEAAVQPLVLVVDDDEEYCENIWQILRDNKFRVGIAHNELEAKKQVDSGQYRVVLLDVQLGNETSARLLSGFGKLDQSPATFVVTGHRSSRNELIQSMLDDGADSVCYKPVEMPKLLDTIERLSGKAR